METIRLKTLPFNVVANIFNIAANGYIFGPTYLLQRIFKLKCNYLSCLTHATKRRICVIENANESNNFVGFDEMKKKLLKNCKRHLTLEFEKVSVQITSSAEIVWV